MKYLLLLLSLSFFSLASSQNKKVKTNPKPSNNKAKTTKDNKYALSFEKNNEDPFLCRIGVIARESNDSIVLRFGVAKPAVWLDARINGYWIERAEYLLNGKLGSYTKLNQKPLLPEPPEMWKPFLNNGPELNDYYSLAYENIYDESGKVEMDFSNKENKGNEMENLLVKKEALSMSYAMAMIACDRNASVAQLSGLRFVDKTVKAGKKYSYRVLYNGKHTTYKVDTGYVSVTAKPYIQEKPKKSFVEVKDKSLVLRWLSVDGITIYYVDKSSDNGKSYVRETPMGFFTSYDKNVSVKIQAFADTNVKNYSKYLYRVWGATPFGDEQLLVELSGMPKDLTPPAPVFLANPKQIKPKAVLIKWEVNKPSDDLVGFNVLRDTRENGTFKTKLNKTILPITSREFIDTNFSIMKNNFYKIESIDTAGNTSLSFSAYVVIIDSTPTSAPKWVKFSIDSIKGSTNALVKLQVRKPKEYDFWGYRLYKSNAQEHEFSLIKETINQDSVVVYKDSIFTDTVTMNSLTKYVYYKISAVDFNQNESKPSSLIAVKRPDIIPPVSPVIKDIKAYQDSIVIVFEPSSSDDVKKHIVYKKLSSEVNWKQFKELNSTANKFLDKDVIKNEFYDYAVMAIDSTGLKSPMSFKASAKAYDTYSLPDIKNFTSTYVNSELQFNWDYAEKGAIFYVIYLKNKKNAFDVVTTITDSKQKTWKKSQLLKPGKYEYYIKAFLKKSPKESKLSEPAIVIVPNNK